MIGHDFIGLLSADATVAVYLTVLVLLGGAVSGVVALGVMQTEIRANVQREAFLAFFYPPFGDLKNSNAARSIREFADSRGLSLFSLHYRQLAGQLLAIATNKTDITAMLSLPAVSKLQL